MFCIYCIVGASGLASWTVSEEACYHTKYGGFAQNRSIYTQRPADWDHQLKTALTHKPESLRATRATTTKNIAEAEEYASK